MSEIIVGLIGVVGILLAYILKRPDREQANTNNTIDNLRRDLDRAILDASAADKRAKSAVARVEVLEERDRRRYQYELKHRLWDVQVLHVVRTVEPEFPDPPPFSLLDPVQLSYERQSDGNLD